MATEEKSEDSELGHDQTSLGLVRTKRIRRRTGFPLELTSLPNEIRREKTANKINENNHNLEENINLDPKPPTMREKSPSELNQKQSTSNRKNSQRKVKYNPVRFQEHDEFFQMIKKNFCIYLKSNLAGKYSFNTDGLT